MKQKKRIIPMSYIENETLIGGLRDYEQALRDLQGELREHAQDEATRQVAEYFDGVHDFIKDTLDQLDEDLSESAAKTFNQYTPGTHPMEDLDQNLPMPEDAETLIKWSLERQNHVVEWCRNLSGKSISPETTELFGRIADRLRELNRQLAYDTKAYEQDHLHS